MLAWDESAPNWRLLTNLGNVTTRCHTSLKIRLTQIECGPTGQRRYVQLLPPRQLGTAGVLRCHDDRGDDSSTGELRRMCRGEPLTARDTMPNCCGTSPLRGLAGQQSRGTVAIAGWSPRQRLARCPLVCCHTRQYRRRHTDGSSSIYQRYKYSSQRPIWVARAVDHSAATRRTRSQPSLCTALPPRSPFFRPQRHRILCEAARPSTFIRASSSSS